MAKLTLKLFLLLTYNLTLCFASTKAIIFDCDGTLIDDSAFHYQISQYAFDKQGYNLTPDEFWDFMHKNVLIGAPTADEEIAKYACTLLGRNCADEILKDMDMHAHELRKRGLPPIEATVHFVHQLAKEKHILGLKLGLASGNNKANIVRNLQNLGIEEHFDVIVSGSDDLAGYFDPEGTNKPKPYIYLQAAKLLGALPEECVAIEDSKTGIRAAVDAGCITVAIPNAITRFQDLSNAHLQIESFSEILPMHFLQVINDYKEKMSSERHSTRENSSQVILGP